MPETDQKPAADQKPTEQASPADKGQRRTAPAPAPEPTPVERRRARPEDAMVVSALLDLHRTCEAKAESTIRGRSPSIGNRYLEAAKALGDELVLAVLGPATKA
jgi:hypothetical protein